MDENRNIFVTDQARFEEFLETKFREVLKDELPKVVKSVIKKDWLTKEELIELTGWSGRTIQHMRDSKQIPYSQHGRKILYPRKGIVKFLEDHYVEPKADV